MDINAFATAGHTVAVTDRAVQALSPTALEAVLAHELGPPSWWPDLGVFVALLVRAPGSLHAQFATYLNLALLSAFSSGNVAMSLVAGVGVALVVGLLLVDLPVVGVAVAVGVRVPFGVLWLERSQEHPADLVAVRLGYGAELANMLRGTSSERPAGNGPGTSWLTRVGRSHPGEAERVQRIQQELQREDRAKLGRPTRSNRDRA